MLIADLICCASRCKPWHRILKPTQHKEAAMLEMMEIGIDNAVAFRMSGKITETDMSLVLSHVKEKIKRYGSIVLLEQIDSFKGVEIAAIVEEFKYLFEEGISNISRAAVVTDKKWVGKIASFEDKIFKKIKIKYFPMDEKDSAIEFLKKA